MSIEKYDVPRDLAGFCGPASVDSMIREAIKMCWILLPNDQRSLDVLRREIQRFVDRALKNLEEDAQAFGIQAT